ncbi:cyclic nucleotide-binding protein [Siphonobacter sp. BAB-5405]|uniref:Crp/Fnr family transcriptional regulator n=1 Tax=Siphonobacter sp. BAB-5405 TaxID=1864825 RepID=UPI000C809A6D|nr:Crp/Fnr family transcriptional regulator [Siphonobacter sp. BAB-5405]PMD92573.1 cyclic nucleotide-binding protein [Siphonobacter sp. BAB-5405]
MLAIFENYMKAQHIDLTEEQIQMITAAAVERTVSRKTILLQAGDICRHKIFITKGFLRTYRIGADGTEHIMQFSPELNWTTDGESYTHRTPSSYIIEALEDSQLMIWNRDRFDTLLQTIPNLRTYSEQLISRHLHLSRNRLYQTFSATPAEKYEDFLQAYPGILSRVPLRMVASYLGVSLKTLTRIRQDQLRQPVK